MSEAVAQGSLEVTELAEHLSMLGRIADQTAASSLSSRTREAYAHDVAMFAAWCERAGARPFPLDVEVVRLWVADLSMQVAPDGGLRYAPSSIERFLAALSRVNYDLGHGRGGTRHPRIAEVLSGLRRQRQHGPSRAEPLLTDDISRILSEFDFSRWPAGVSAARDRLALLLGYEGALRVSEVAALDRRDIELTSVGLLVRLRRSKTDQYGLGRKIGIPYAARPVLCAGCAYTRWTVLLDSPARSQRMRHVLANDNDSHLHALPMAPSSLPGAPLMTSLTRSGEVRTANRLSTSALREMLARRLVAAGYDPRPYSFHSLRAGFVTQARRNGASARDVRLQTGHRSDSMVDVYDREYDPFSAGSAVALLGI